METVKKKILIVEDDSFVMDIYQTKLAQAGFDIIEAANGVEAMKILEKENPNLILLDILMPYMDGMEVLEKIKKEERFKNTPVILLTNLSQQEEVKHGLELGARDYLIKSHFTPSEVLDKINSYLKEK